MLNSHYLSEGSMLGHSAEGAKAYSCVDGMGQDI
jgi:hypothetical protein